MKNEIPQRIIHYGYIKDEELNELYSLADLFFGPSVAEAMGKTFLEAQLCGTPVLCFDETGPADIVSHLESGYLARYKDTDDLLCGLQYCLNKTWNQENISQSAQEQFDINISAAKYKRLYEKSIVDWSNSSS
jgi:glycosyltransferase involved in cell wall biosynthesis